MTRIVLLLLLPFAASAGPLDELSEMMQGRFDTHGAERTAGNTSRLVDSRQRASAPELGAVVFYLQLNRNDDLSLYRQRILVFSSQNGRIVQKAYLLNEPERFVDAEDGDEVLGGIAPADVTPMFREGCETVWTKTDGGFRGYTDPSTCRIISSRTGKPRRIEAEAVLTKDTLSLVERGYDDDMNQLFGTPQGESTVLHRVP